MYIIVFLLTFDNYIIPFIYDKTICFTISPITFLRMPRIPISVFNETKAIFNVFLPLSVNYFSILMQEFADSVS